MMYSNQKLAIDLLIAVFATFILTTTILAVSTNQWQINSNQERIGLFQQCTIPCCCQTQELSRTVTWLALFSVALLLTSTILSFFAMTTTTEERTRCYLFVPMVFFGAGMTMTSTLIHIMDLISINSYAAFIFMIDNVLAYVLGGMTLLHGCVFYFS